MKRYYIFGLISIVLSFVACNKVQPETPLDEEDYYYTFALSNPSTKSLLASDENGKFGAWEEGDKIGTSIDGANPGYAYVTTSTSPVTFRIYKKGGLAGGETVYVYYPYNSSASSVTAIPMEIPAGQNQDGNNFDYDAMPMAAEGFVVPASYASEDNNTEIGEISLLNLGSVIDFQVFSSDATYAEETILSVKFAASSAIAGGFSKDITAVKFNDESTFAISGFSGTEVTTTVTNAPAIGATRANAAHIYMVVAPVSGITGSVIVTTNKAIYTYSMAKAQSFTRAGLKSFGLDLGTCQNRVAEETAIPVFVRKTISEILEEMGKSNVEAGTEVNPLILDGVVTISTTGTVNNGKVYGVSPSQEWRLYQNGNGNVVVSVTTGYELQSIQFTYSTSNGGTLEGAASGAELSVSGNSQTYSVKNTGTATNGQVKLTAISVKYVAATPVYTTEFDQDSDEITVEVGKTKNNNVTVNSGATITYTSEDEDIATVAADGTVTGVSVGATTINYAVVANGSYPAASGSFGVTVTPAIAYKSFCWDLTSAPHSASEAALNWNYRGVTMVSSRVGTNTAANNYCPPTQSSTRFYKNNKLTITPYSESTIGYVEFVATTESYATALATSTWANATASVSGTTVTVEPTDGATAFSATIGNTCGFTEVTVYYTGELEELTNHTVTFTQPENGCAFTVSVGGSAINSGAEVTSGTEVTLAATAGTDYEFTSWTVTDASNNAVAVTNNKFTMPSSDVTISAIFSRLYTITCNPASNGSISASAERATSGAVITLTSTPQSGYHLASWTVTDSSNNEVTVTTDNKFTMPADNVTVNATFAENQGDVVVYTLAPVSTGGNSSPHNNYAAATTVTISGIEWSVKGNSNMVPWRIGGKSITAVDREIYSTTAISNNISKIEFTHGAASSITVNSMTVIVSKNADFSNPVSTLTPTFEANETVTVNRPDGKDWSNCYYKIVYNVTVSGSSNKFLEFTKAEFTGK